MTRAGRLRSCLVAAVFAASATVAAVAQTADPFSGTWKLNLEKSKYAPGPAPKNGTATFSTAAGKVKVVVDGVAGDNTKTHWEYTATADGKDYPVTGNPDAEMISVKQLNPRSVETVYKKGGKATLTNVRTVSADGKTLTVTQKGTNAQGQTVNNTLVFEKM